MLWPLFTGCSLRCLLLSTCMRDTIAQANAFLSVRLEAAELAGVNMALFAHRGHTRCAKGAA